MTITEFLEARITEDEAMSEYTHDSWPWSGTSREVRDHSCMEFGREPESCDCARPAIILRECAAKRSILERADKMWGDEAERRFGPGGRDDYFLDEILRPLAAVYSDHPDYDPTWSLT